MVRECMREMRERIERGKELSEWKIERKDFVGDRRIDEKRDRKRKRGMKRGVGEN